jgi:hypothetical protein
MATLSYASGGEIGTVPITEWIGPQNSAGVIPQVNVDAAHIFSNSFPIPHVGFVNSQGATGHILLPNNTVLNSR